MKNTPTAMRLRVSAMSVHPTPLNSISIIVAVTCRPPEQAFSHCYSLLLANVTVFPYPPMSGNLPLDEINVRASSEGVEQLRSAKGSSSCDGMLRACSLLREDTDTRRNMLFTTKSRRRFRLGSEDAV